MAGLEAQTAVGTITMSSDGVIRMEPKKIQIVDSTYLEEMVRCLLDNGYKVILERTNQADDEEGYEVTICI